MGLTEFGFEWGPMTVTRAATIPSGYVLNIKTDAGREIDVYVSAQGRSLRVFGRGQGRPREWKPPLADPNGTC